MQSRMVSSSHRPDSVKKGRHSGQSVVALRTTAALWVNVHDNQVCQMKEYGMSAREW